MATRRTRIASVVSVANAGLANTLIVGRAERAVGDFRARLAWPRRFCRLLSFANSMSSQVRRDLAGPGRASLDLAAGPRWALLEPRWAWWYVWGEPSFR